MFDSQTLVLFIVPFSPDGFAQIKYNFLTLKRFTIMSTLSKFSQFALTPSEMRAVAGGNCMIFFDTSNGGCESVVWGVTGSKNQAIKTANKYMGSNFGTSGTVTGWRISC
jgi:hypothetical protein